MKTWLRIGGGAMAGLLCSFSALAQEADPAAAPGAAADQPPPAAPATVASAGDDDANSMAEVIVTARKREERLRDVPLAASAITEAMRESLALDNMDDYLRQVPGTTLVTSGPEYLNDVSIRGQGSGRLGFSETATGIYRDGMYAAGGGYGGRSLSRMDLFDLDRMEVLRGPQGALFGRNSVGGAINVVSKRPEAESGGQLTVRAASRERRDVEAVVNAPLSDSVGLRVGALVNDQNDGYVINDSTGHAIDDQRYTGLRTQLDYTPVEALRLGAMYEYYKSDGPAFSNLGQRPLRVDGTPLDTDRDHRAELSREGRTKVDQNYGLLSADYSLPWAALAVKLSHAVRDGGRHNEDNAHYAGQSGIDVTPGADTTGPDYTVAQDETYRRTGLQAFLSSTGDGPWSWLGGIEGLWSRSDVANGPNLCPDYTGTAHAATPGCYPGLAGTLSATGAQVRSAVRLGLNHDDFAEDLNSYSLYGSLDRKLTEKLKLGLELRVQRDSKEFNFARYADDPLVYFGGGTPPAGMMAPISIDPDGAAGPRTAAPVQFCPPSIDPAQCPAGYETVHLKQSRDWTFWTPAATLHYSFTPKQAVYVRFATGYRPGGFNTQPPPTTVRDDLQAMLVYKPEKANSYELGWKGSLFGGIEGEAAVFYTDTRDVQVVTVPSTTSRSFVLQTAGDAYVYGAELELRKNLRLGPGRLMSSLAVSTQDGEFRDGATALLDTNGDGTPDQADLGGKQVPRLRDYQLTVNLAYTAPLSERLTGIAGLSFQAANGGYETPENTARYEGYTLLDARLGVQGERWKLSAFGRNLGNQRYVLDIVGADYFWNEPRSFGVELTVNY
ncbi:TonB-dependent receptor [Solimonas variicoloris]|uniref:TonB-dependent receptor n=1 Tax=Solimonas variicoloris TaxID=254408 RepID=UPI000375416F|nr:TonB-dependent receptor [Solimonas variicoloris]